MCFNSCEFLNFNPNPGEDKCKLPSDGDCPMDEEETTEEEEGDLK